MDDSTAAAESAAVDAEIAARAEADRGADAAEIAFGKRQSPAQTLFAAGCAKSSRRAKADELRALLRHAERAAAEARNGAETEDDLKRAADAERRAEVVRHELAAVEHAADFAEVCGYFMDAPNRLAAENAVRIFRPPAQMPGALGRPDRSTATIPFVRKSGGIGSTNR